ncbi:MAG: 2,3-bisphosphoglycerate-independent phosphoglycerate mutase [Bacteroidia bacterium]|nr:2,3-bisphosphoglycerate-independent phosphoglycerate mutase [Bacteroidia bacterium]
MNKALLLILDGWGIGKKDNTDAIFSANTPFIDSLESQSAKATLKTYGENVGLPDGQMGNSEVGHMNIGAGRVVWQMLVRINKAFKDQTIHDLPAIKSLIELAQSNKNRKIHLMGLVSDGGVHSSIDHLLGLTELLKENNLDDRVYIHAFMDGRDTDPRSGKDFIKNVQESSKIGRSSIATITGRYYAMDRDQRWERTKLAYDAMIHGSGVQYDDCYEAIQKNYDEEVTDEFIKPCIINQSGQISEDDIVLCFNFRTDRGRQISKVLTQENMPNMGMKTMNIHYFTMTEYDKTYNNVNVLFHSNDLTNTLGEVLSKNAKTQLRAAETEKYPHVTFFFNGGREEPFIGEERVMANSPKVATYDLQPEMSALELTDKVMNHIEINHPDFVCVNYANPDMVGHTGVFSAIEKACEVVDSCAKNIVDFALKKEYSIVIIADHGNADKALNADGSPNTAHTTNLVPIYLLSNENKTLKDGKLADIAPTILSLMRIDQPQDMDGISLL